MIVVSRPDYTLLHVASLGFGRYNVIKGHQLNTRPLSKKEALKMQNAVTPVDALQSEIAAVDNELAELDLKERAGEQDMADLALKSHRGDDESGKQLREFLASKEKLHVRRYQLQSARQGIEKELIAARQVAERAREHARAEEAKTICERLRKRGEVIDVTLRTLVDDLRAVETDLQELAKLTPARTGRDVIRVNVDRGLRSVLADLEFLQLQRVAVGDRRTFAELAAGWADAPENWADNILLGKPDGSPPSTPSRSTPPRRPNVKALEPSAATMPTRRAASIHDASRGAPLKERNLTG
jgi:hypothetical protein